jgi:hypothetical protein
MDQVAVEHQYRPVRPASAADAVWIRDVLRERWGATTIVVHGEVIDAARLPALIAETQRGLATFQRLGGDAELVTLDAIPAGIGTGTALIEAGQQWPPFPSS